RAATPAELDAALAACEREPGTLAFIEVVLDRHDMPRLLFELATAVATENARAPEATASRHEPDRLGAQRRPRACAGPGPTRRRAR
ncbi:MAG TPA: hypothetical protein VK631_24635, partial [Solirubrobacteraceae bacterium]|nr:hypothetical protein [Solirubrobacteraceae bacterium]